MIDRLVLSLRPEWNAIKAAWDPCLAFLSSHGLTHDEAYALSMAAQELLENAVKYGPGGEAPIVCVLEIATRCVTVEVKSAAPKDLARLRVLDDTIQWIRGFQDPFEAYVERLKRVSAQPLAPGESGLGLARVAYEAQCILDFYLDDQEVLSLSAVYHPSRKLGVTQGNTHPSEPVH